MHHQPFDDEQLLNVDRVHVGRVPESCCRRHAHNGEYVDRRLCLYSTDENNTRRDAFMYTRSCYTPARIMLIQSAQLIRVLCCVTALVLLLPAVIAVTYCKLVQK